jgi:restriction endonuclease S subunit
MAVDKIDLNNLDKSDWKSYRFDEIALNISERVDPNNTDLEVYIGLEHIDSRSLHIKRFGSPDDVNGTKLKFYNGDIIFGRRRAYQRKAGIATCDGFCSAHALVLRAKSDVVISELLPIFLHSDLFMHRAVDISAGSLSPTINWGTLKRQEFIIPPKEDQEKLSEVLWAAENDIRSKQLIEEKLTLVKRSFSQSHYYNKKIPKLYISDVCEKIQDGSHYSPQNLYNENDGSRYIYLTSKNIRSSGLDMKKIQYVDSDFHEKIYKRCDVKLGDVLLTKDGANTGLATLNTISEEMSLLSSVCLLRVNEKVMTKSYLCHYLNSDIGFTQMTGRMTGTAIKRLTLKTINKTKIPCPSIEQQELIDNKLDHINKTMLLNSQSIVSCYAVQKSMLNKVF